MPQDEIRPRETTTADLPGRLVLVVGPSGSGKDTLIAAARIALAGDPRYVFPRRIVTRPASAAEDNVHADAVGFAEARARGAFALDWSAHGHAYAIPAAIDVDLAAGAVVVINVSRTVVAEARRRWPDVSVVAVDAPPEVLAARVAARGRPSDGDGAERVTRRPQTVDPHPADVRIDNGGDLAAAVAAFIAAVVRA